MANKANPNTSGNVVQLPGSGLSDESYIIQSDDLLPDDLNDKETKVWKRIAPELAKLGRLKIIYVDVIAEYCRLVVRMSKTRKWLDDHGWVYTTEGRHGSQKKSQPDVAQFNDDWRKFRSLIGELGLSPSAEKTLSASQGDLFDKNPFENY